MDYTKDFKTQFRPLQLIEDYIPHNLKGKDPYQDDYNLAVMITLLKTATTLWSQTKNYSGPSSRQPNPEPTTLEETQGYQYEEESPQT